MLEEESDSIKFIENNYFKELLAVKKIIWKQKKKEQHAPLLMFW